jgi:hypothetical protein
VSDDKTPGTPEDRQRIQQELRDLATEVLQREKTNPGQDPSYVRWATETLNASTAVPSSPAPPAVPAQPQSSGPANASLEAGSESVLQIRQTPAPGQTISPTKAPDQSDRGEGAAQ